MARPTQPKDVKPKADDASGDEKAGKKGGGGGAGMNLLVMALIIILCSALSSAASIYFLAPMVLKPLMSATAGEGEEGLEGEEGEEGAEGEEGEEGEEAEEPPLPHVGPVIDLEEFTVNLKDPKADRYLRADLSIMVSTDDPKFGTVAGEEAHKWEEEFHHEMAHYVSSIRDVVIGALTRRTATELATEIGKEQVKEEIKRNVNALFHGERQVIRVNLENFIIQ